VAKQWTPWRLAAYTLVGVLASAGFLFAWHQMDQFLIANPRFVLAETEDETDSRLLLDGLRYAPRHRVEALFREDLGRSVYLIPLAERRRQMLAIDWVRDAAVSRVWPDRVAVHITERTPMAFVRPTAPGANPDLIDEDGVILTLGDSAKFRLPVVTGVTRNQPEVERKQRIRRLMKLESEIGRHMERVSEVDLSDLDNLRVVYALGDRAMILHLGHGRYGVRLRRFLENREEIIRRLPKARTLDLRLEDQIIAVPDKPDGGSDAR
jgi:cell division protein FtsQ